MTRKRFVKLLMACGVSRNTANQEAREAVSRGVSYDKRMVDDAVRIIAECIPTIVEAINAAIPQVIANIERLKQEAETATE